MRIWCEFNRVLTDDIKSSKYCSISTTLNFTESPWKNESAKLVWQIIANHNPILFCRSAKNKKYLVKSQREAWNMRELGRNVDVYVYTSTEELFQKMEPGSLLISCSEIRTKHWEALGGMFWLHRNDDKFDNVLFSKTIQSWTEKKQEANKDHIHPTRQNIEFITYTEKNEFNPLLLLACQNIYRVVANISYINFEWSGTDHINDGDVVYDLASTIKSLRSCACCLRKWSLVYAFLKLGLKFTDSNGCSSVSQCPCDRHGTVFCEMFTAEADQSCMCSRRVPCVEALSDVDTWVVLERPELKVLHLMVLNYCVGYQPCFVLTREMNDSHRWADNHQIESVFVDTRHLCCYRDALEWREQVTNLVVRSRKAHVGNIQNVWTLLVEGEEGEQDPPYSDMDSEIEACMDAVLSNWRIPNDDVDSWEDTRDATLPLFSGIGIAWKSYDALSTDFCEGRLFHFLPLWQIVCGVIDCVAYLEQRAAWKKKRFADNRWKVDYLICVSILRLLLDSRRTDRDLGGGLGYVDLMLASVRGRCWMRLLTCLRQVGASVSEVDDAIRNALDACGQLRSSGGGVTAADIEDIEHFAASYRAVICRNQKRQKKSAPTVIPSDEAMTPPKQYLAPVGHSQRHFKGVRVRHREANNMEDIDKKENEGVAAKRSKRKRVIYRKTSITPSPSVDKGTRVAYAENLPVFSGMSTLLNDRLQGMIVEKFALCRYLSLIADPNTAGNRTANTVELHLYDDERGEIADEEGDDDLGRCIHVTDFLETRRGPGAWVHGRATRSSLPGEEEEWLASYCEGSIWTTLFMLVLWDIIYDTSRPLSMLRDFLDRPIDLLPERHSRNMKGSPIRSDGFYQRRRSAITRVLNRIRKSSVVELYETLETALQRHTGKRCYGINWLRLESEFVLSVGCALGGERLAIIIEEMVRDPVCYGRGMPDLLMCVHHRHSLNSASHVKDNGSFSKDKTLLGGPSSSSPWSEHSIFVSEVKSTHDKLSVWQKLWIRLFDRVGVFFEECRVNS